MQQFTRALTREIEVGGERLALTLSKEGLSVRPVGGRRPPYTMSWEACLHACVEHAGQGPSAEELQEVLKNVRAGAAKAAEKTEAKPKSPPAAHTAPAPSAPAATAASSSAPRGAPSQPAPGGDKITLLLARLDQWLNTHRERFQQALQPGATARECDELAAVLGRPLPEDLRTLLMWHNGQNPDVPGGFEESWILMSTEEIAEAKKELDAQPHEGWHKSWLPFLDNDSGDYRCVDLDTSGSPVLECWRGRKDHPVIAPSLSTWLEAFVNALERGAYAEDPERGSLMLRS
jgi:cell wall assembly regulator SMI1